MLDIIKKNKATYDLIGAEFSDTRDRLWPEMELLVKKYVKKNNKILDVGCGNARLLGRLNNVYYLGVDSSKELINQAKRKLGISYLPYGTQKLQATMGGNRSSKFINFKELDMLRLGKLQEKNFDIVFMFASFNHIPSKELRLKVLEDVKKLLKPAGLLIMTNWNLWQMGVKKNVWNCKIRRKKMPKNKKSDVGFKDVITFWESRRGNAGGELYYRAFTKRELRQLLRTAGFKIIENYYSDKGKKSRWYKARNIVSAARRL